MGTETITFKLTFFLSFDAFTTTGPLFWRSELPTFPSAKENKRVKIEILQLKSQYYFKNYIFITNTLCFDWFRLRQTFIQSYWWNWHIFWRRWFVYLKENISYVHLLKFIFRSLLINLFISILNVVFVCFFFRIERLNAWTTMWQFKFKDKFAMEFI